MNQALLTQITNGRAAGVTARTPSLEFKPRPSDNGGARLAAIEAQLQKLSQAIESIVKTVNANDDEVTKLKKVVKGAAVFLKKTAEQVDNVTSYLAGEGNGEGVVDGGGEDAKPVQATKSAPAPTNGLSSDDWAAFTQGDDDGVPGEG